MKTKILDSKDTKKASDLIKAGGLVAMPTETVYGLFANALDKRAVEEVFKVKGRSSDHNLNLNVASYEDIYRYSKNQPVYLKKLVEKFMPGPLTIILEASDEVPTYINRGRTSVGFRMPAYEPTRQTIKKTGVLVGPSANITGEASPYKGSQVEESFTGKIDAILIDDSPVSGLDSTIIDLTEEVPRILRQGAISLEEIGECYDFW